ncbi:MmgE/PrpD family protein [Micromonospora sp. NPDC048830]|uniref:MmgE/PrpD family protein n=1 Tax=Micromonospora sp. NPDC048830 TaxID=3364257 RepID=UPI003711B970
MVQQLAETLPAGLTVTDARTRARQAVVDTLTAMIAGAGTTEAQLVRAAVGRGDTGAQAVVVGTDQRRSAPGAALCNGTAAHALEIDDFGGCGHSGAVVLPAVLALSEVVRPSGTEFLDAVIAGYEAAGRATALLGGYRAQTDRGWHVTGTCGAFGAAAAAARLLGLNVGESAHALAIAGSCTGGVWAFLSDGAMTKRLHAGRAAQIGVESALLAAEGFTGPAEIFEASFGGLADCMAGGTLDETALRPETQPAILSAGFKRHAACRGVHWAIDTTLALMREEHLAGDDVAAVRVECPPHALRMFGSYQVATAISAQLSLPFAVSAALRYGDRVNDAYRGAAWQDDAVRRHLDKVVLSPAHECGPQVRIRTVAGRDLVRGVPPTHDDCTGVLDEACLASKVDEWVSPVLGPDRAAHLLATCLGLDESPSVDALLDVATIDERTSTDA